MARVKVYKVAVFDAIAGENRDQEVMATREGAEMMRGTVKEDSEVEIDDSQLEFGKQWTPRGFVPTNEPPSWEDWVEATQKSSPEEALLLREHAIRKLESNPNWSAYIRESERVLTANGIDVARALATFPMFHPQRGNRSEGIRT